MLLLSLGPRQKAAVKRLINCYARCIKPNCRLAYTRFSKNIDCSRAKSLSSFLVGDRTENETSGEKGTTRSSGNVFELSAVKRSNYSTLVSCH